MKGNPRVLTDDQIREGKALREEGFTKSALAEMFGVGMTTVWDNIFSDGRHSMGRPRKMGHRRARAARICVPCKVCEICLTEEFDGVTAKTNFRIGDACLSCYLRSMGFDLNDL